jgi:hypothetical protein
MGQFKPMVKMITTEPTVELKLKKGGHVSMKGKGEHGHKSMPHMMDGGITPAMSGAMPSRGGMAPVASPARPPLAARRRRMAVPPMGATAAPPMASPAPAMMKKGGESKAEHKAEMKGIKGLEKELKSHESKPASKGHKGLKTGGVVMGNGGGFKKGGIAKSGIIPESASARGAEGYKNTKMHDGGKKDVVPAKTGDIKLNKVAGYKDGGSVMKYAENNVVGTPPGKSNTKTGDVKLGNAGGYKKGGAAKKYARGGMVDSGNVEKMPQGRKKPSAPVSITALSGTFKKGGKVMKMNGGGSTSDREQDLSKGAYDRFYSDQKKENEAMRDTILGAPGRMIERVKGFFGGAGNKPDLPSGSVTKTEKSVTVTPKKRGGAVKC